MAAMSRALRLFGGVVLGAVVVVILGSAAIYLLSNYRLSAASTSAPGASISVPTDVASIQHGQHLAGAIARCTECHGPSLTGMVIRDDASARVVAPDITRGGVTANFSDADYAHAIRDGLDPSGRPLWLMPTDDYARLSDADLGALIAYLKSLPPVASSLPGSELHPLGRLLLAAGQATLLPAAEASQATPRPSALAPDATPEYGEYLATIAGCARCHGPGLSGGAIPGAPRGTPPAANLTPASLGDWSEADFLRAMRSGRRPDGSAIDAAMPWPYYAQMNDLELRAIWEFLGVVPPRPNGSH
jgi:cytochrome c553